MSRKIKTLCIVLIAFFSLSLMTHVSAVGINLAVGPAFIQEDNANRNQTYHHIVYLFNDNDYDVVVEINATGYLHEWVTFYNYGELEIPITEIFMKNNSERPINVVFKVPETAANGDYRGDLLFTAKPDLTNPSNSNISTLHLTTPIIALFNITGDQNLNISVHKISIKNEELDYPVEFRIELINNGDVEASPYIKIDIFNKVGEHIDTLFRRIFNINAGEISKQTLQWDTTGKYAENYTANITIQLDDHIIYHETKLFAINPIGTKERNGTLEYITYDGELKKGNTLKIIGIFKNRGDIKVKAQFIGEVYKDGSLIDTIESPEKLVEKYKTENLISYYKIEENGDYIITGYVHYSEYDTSFKELKLKVQEPAIISTTQIIAIIAIIFAGGALVYLFFFRKKKYSFNFTRKEKIKKERKPLKLDFSPFLNVIKKTPRPTLNLKIKRPSISRPVRTKKVKVRSKPEVKKKERKSGSLNIEEMSAKEIEEYVKGL